MKRACVAIGVDRVVGVPNLPPLTAAADGAERFAEWAGSQHFDAFTFTDRAGVLRVSAAKQQIRVIAQSGIYSQLIVYFAGHGILKSWDTEVWLLSDAGTDADEAVNLAGSVSLARQSGIPHVVFVSDACRSIASEARLAQIRGSVLFPILPVTPQRPEIDTFYATLPGDPSYEFPAARAAANYHGVFTACLLRGLAGPDSSLYEVVNEQDQLQYVVSSRTLKPWLEREVPQSLHSVSNTFNQIPELRVESQRPKYLAVLPGPPPAPPSQSPRVFAFRPTPTASSTNTLRRLADQHGLTEFFAPRLAEPVIVSLPVVGPQSVAFNTDMERLAAVGATQSFEMQTGFTVVGARILKVVLEGRPFGFDVFDTERGAMHVRVQRDESPSWVVIQFADGSGTSLATLPGYIGNVTVEDGRVVNVSYTPSPNSGLWNDYQVHQVEVEKRRAFVAVAARMGLLKLEKDRAASLAGYVRQLKVLDPTLGIYAAYAYNQAGMIEEVNSILQWMSRDQQSAVPFDVALLANQLANPNIRIAGRTPMLTQGWALLHEGLPVSQIVMQASNFTLPALWTTLSAQGVAVLTEMLKP